MTTIAKEIRKFYTLIKIATYDTDSDQKCCRVEENWSILKVHASQYLLLDLMALLDSRVE